MKIKISGCVDISKAANPLSTYCNAHTALPLPIVKKRNPAIALFINCFEVLFLNFPVMNVNINMSMPATVNLMPAKRNGGISCTRILLNK